MLYIHIITHECCCCPLPDHAGGGVAHGGVLGLYVLGVVVDAAVDLIVLFTGQLLVTGQRFINDNMRNGFSSDGISKHTTHFF